VAVADIFDALTAQRPYKKEWSLDEAFAELQRQAEQGKLDADCVNALAAQREAVADIHSRYTDPHPDHTARG
jgi:HD-GYP domain-containing protein (c-di-GMP phosphodiesterase class II)